MVRRPVGGSHLVWENSLRYVLLTPRNDDHSRRGLPRWGSGLVNPPGDALILTVREEDNLNGFQIDFQPVFQ
jgi:hypothetical protein